MYQAAKEMERVLVGLATRKAAGEDVTAEIPDAIDKFDVFLSKMADANNAVAVTVAMKEVILGDRFQAAMFEIDDRRLIGQKMLAIRMLDRKPFQLVA